MDVTHTHGWEMDAWLAGSMAAMLLLYGLGVRRLWTNAGSGRGAHLGSIALFAAGWIIVALATIGPLDSAADNSFAFHMVQHELLMVIAAPLLVLARPGPVFLWALPPALRQRWRAIVHAPAVARPWRIVSTPLVATLIHAVAIWAWHAPSLFARAVADEAIHRLQHMSFFLAAVLFWWSLMGARRSASYGVGALCLFVTSLHCGLLGGLLALSSRSFYAGGSAQSVFGLSPLEDQQLGGLIMWVPGGTIYSVAALALLGLWIVGARPASESRHAHAG